jgi:trk system potassium uptake protein
MHIIVVGCGRVGSTVARELVESGHSVCVVDRKAEAFRRLGTDFVSSGGRTLEGVGFDRDTLLEAGVSDTCSVAAVTSGDNSNILIARVAREVFGAQVVARIYDPRRASIFQRLGIPTVASVEWTAGRVLANLVPDLKVTEWVDPSARFVLIERRVNAAAAGMTVASVEGTASARVALLSRTGAASVPTSSMVLQEDDMIHVMVSGAGLEKLDAALQTQGQLSVHTKEGHS